MNACQTERNKHLEAVPDVTQLMWVQTQRHLQRKDQLQLLQHYTCKVKPTFVIFGHEQERIGLVLIVKKNWETSHALIVQKKPIVYSTIENWNILSLFYKINRPCFCWFNSTITNVGYGNNTRKFLITHLYRHGIYNIFLCSPSNPSGLLHKLTSPKWGLLLHSMPIYTVPTLTEILLYRVNVRYPPQNHTDNEWSHMLDIYTW